MLPKKWLRRITNCDAQFLKLRTTTINFLQTRFTALYSVQESIETPSETSVRIKQHSMENAAATPEQSSVVHFHNEKISGKGSYCIYHSLNPLEYAPEYLLKPSYKIEHEKAI